MLLTVSPLVAFLGLPGGIELVIVMLVVLLLFGNRLPGLMRSLGSSVSEFKKGQREGELEDHSETTPSTKS